MHQAFLRRGQDQRQIADVDIRGVERSATGPGSEAGIQSDGIDVGGFSHSAQNIVPRRVDRFHAARWTALPTSLPTSWLKKPTTAGDLLGRFRNGVRHFDAGAAKG